MADEQRAGDVKPGTWIALGIGLAALVGGGVFFVAVEQDPSGPIETEIALPEPAPPTTRPLIASGRGGIGWTWINPLPRALPTWYGVAVRGLSDVALVGEGGTVLRYDPAGLSVWPSETEQTLLAAAWLPNGSLVVVGAEGHMAILDGQSARAIPTGTESNLLAVAVLQNTVHAVGKNGSWLVADPASGEVEQIQSGTTNDLMDLHVQDGSLFAAGKGGVLLRHFDGRAGNIPTGTRDDLHAVGGCDQGALYLVGGRGLILRRRTANFPQDLSESREAFESVDAPTQVDLTDVDCHGETAMVAGRDGTLLLTAQRRTVVLESGTDRTLNAIGAAPEGPTWVVGERGRLLTVERGSARNLTAGPTHPFRALSDISGALVAVGDWGVVARQTEGGFEVIDSPVDAALSGLAPQGRSNLLAVGDEGVVLRVTPSGTETLRSPTRSALRAVSGDGENFIIVGTSGTVVTGRVNGTERRFRSRHLEGVGDLWDVVGVPTDAISVGTEGTVIRFVDDRTVRVNCDLSADLLGLTRLGDVTWGVGRQGAVIRIENYRCEVVRAPREGDPDLYAAGTGPEGNLMVVGDQGTALMRDGDRFLRANLNVAGANLYAIHRTSRYVYLAGSGGVLVRHVRLDGAVGN